MNFSVLTVVETILAKRTFISRLTMVRVTIVNRWYSYLSLSTLPTFLEKYPLYFKKSWKSQFPNFTIINCYILFLLSGYFYLDVSNLTLVACRKFASTRDILVCTSVWYLKLRKVRGTYVLILIFYHQPKIFQSVQCWRRVQYTKKSSFSIFLVGKYSVKISPSHGLSSGRLVYPL